MHEFELHRHLEQKEPTALVSVSDRPIEALHRAFVKYYNQHEDPQNIWIAIISVPDRENGAGIYHHAEKLAKALDIEGAERLRHEYVFEWQVPEEYVKHTVSVGTLLDRGLNLDPYLDEEGRLPGLSTFRSLMIDMDLGSHLDGYCVGRELGRMAKCFGARAPVKEIAHRLLIDCPIRCVTNGEMQFFEWESKKCPDTSESTVDYIDFTHFYWISAGINEALFDNWLADSAFVEEFNAHAEWANDWTAKIETRWQIFWDQLHYTGSSCHLATDEDELGLWEQEILAMIERDALITGL